MPSKHRPSVVVLAGPNGAGKSTTAADLLRGALGVTEFVNPDLISQGLSVFEPERVAMAAGRVMLRRIHELGRERVNFAFETTLASRSFAPWLAKLRDAGYRVHVVFLWLPGVELAIARVKDRVRRGGHNVPEEHIRRRYVSGLRNFFRLYQPLASTWQFLDNSGDPPPRMIARGRGRRVTGVADRTTWQQIMEGYSHGKSRDEGY